MVSEPPFELCSLKLITQWEWSEKIHHANLREEVRGDSVRSALAYFQVNRAFKGIGRDPGVADGIAALLSEYNDEGKTPPVDNVLELAKSLSAFAIRTIGDEDTTQTPISAASKLLWLRLRGKYIIYDDFASTAISTHFAEDLDKQDYRQFCERWNARYQIESANIAAATEVLKQGLSDLPDWNEKTTDRSSALESDWFRRRVFDMYLWEIGRQVNGQD